MTADLTYINDGMFVKFIPQTTAGETAWRVMAEVDGVAAVFTFQAKSTIKQLRDAGYKVEKAKKATKKEMQDIMKELEDAGF